MTKNQTIRALKAELRKSQNVKRLSNVEIQELAGVVRVIAGRRFYKFYVEANYN